MNLGVRTPLPHLGVLFLSPCGGQWLEVVPFLIRLHFASKSLFKSQWNFVLWRWEEDQGVEVCSLSPEGERGSCPLRRSYISEGN